MDGELIELFAVPSVVRQDRADGSVLLTSPEPLALVFTDMVPHAVLGGRLALEQTVIVSRESLRDRGSAPSAILEQMAGRKLTE